MKKYFFFISRPDAVSLVDSFGVCDMFLGSALGSYDGNVYERLYDAAQKSAVNKYEVNNFRVVYDFQSL